ncbi:MAG: DUF4363 family protein [Clostridia bacterium]|nr:DUF4363 family protein [Clostridia bacterium]
MKRLIPAAVIFVFIISVCVCAHIYVDRACDQTVNDIKAYSRNQLTAAALENHWQERKEQLAIFVNHSFLDKVSVYMGQLTLITEENHLEFDTIYKNIQTVLSLIKEEQAFALHSFY